MFIFFPFLNPNFRSVSNAAQAVFRARGCARGQPELSIASRRTLLRAAWQKTVILTGIPAAAGFGGGHGGALWHSLVVLAVTGAKNQRN